MNSLDPVQIAILTIAVFLGSPELAAIVGPYAIICLMASIGAAWSLGGTKGLNALQALGYYVLILATAVVSTFYITVLLVRFFGSYFPTSADGKAETWIMGVVSFLIGAIGPEWRKLIQWGICILKRKGKEKFEGDAK